MSASEQESTDEGYLSECAVGVVSSGERFRVPETLSVVEALTNPRSLKSPATQLWILSLLLSTSSLYFYYQGWLPRFFFVIQFVFWRLGYNAGLGYMLHSQSNWKGFENFFKTKVKSNPVLANALENCVVFQDTNIKPYSLKDYPDQYNSWMLFRYVVMVIMGNDVVSYFALVIVYWKAPDFTSIIDIVLYIVGIGLSVFALWSKADAHRVLGDYAWFYGDFFFLLDKNLVFDGIFQMFPHPMYTVGYLFMYGFMIMCKSYTVFYVSLIGHLCQLVFLTFVENPHIDKTYSTISEPTEDEKERDAILYNPEEGYLNKDAELVMVKNLTLFRGGDVLLLIVMAYVVVFALLVDGVWIHAIHCVLWRLFHTLYCGNVLRQQSEGNKWTDAHYGGNSRDAFMDWKRIYNASVTAVNATYITTAFKMFVWTSSILATSESRLMIFTCGALLVGINIYVSWCVYDAIGDFGFFYGDFFIADVPSKLNYTGIYRYLNNPESSLGFSGYYGLALMSGNVLMLPIAGLSHACAKVHEKLVEQPFLYAKYGKEVRTEGGLRSEMKKKRQLFKESLRARKDEYEQGIDRLKKEIERRKESYERFVARAERQQSKKKN